jgi:hypothetical protein
LVFIDYKQAYNINREDLWNTMISFRILKRYVNMIKLCNYKTEYKMSFLGEMSSALEANSGLHQESALSPTYLI